MTISIPTLTNDAPPAGAQPANASAPGGALLAALGAALAATIPPSSPGNPAAGRGFAQFLPAGTPAKTGSLPAGAEPEAGRAPATTAAKPADAANEQAAVLAAALFWSPPPPAPAVMPFAGAHPPAVPSPTSSVPLPVGPASAPVVPVAVVPVAAPVAGPVPVAPAANAAPAAATDAVPAVPVTNSGGTAPVSVQQYSVLAATAAPSAQTSPVPANPGKEKIARTSRSLRAGAGPETPEGDNTFVSDSPQAGRGVKPIVGIGVAQRAADMPYASDAHRFTVENPAVPRVSPGLNGADVPPAPSPAAPADLIPPTLQAQAHDTVSAVLQAVDAQEQSATAGLRTVKLQFAIGQETLAVRVELRDGTVHAHFQTDSSELRGALAQEWRHAAAAPENVLRLAAPVFDTAARPSGASTSLSADSGASRQQSQSREPAPEFSLRPALSGDPSPASAVTPEAPRLLDLTTVLHLQAFA